MRADDHPSVSADSAAIHDSRGKTSAAIVGAAVIAADCGRLHESDAAVTVPAIRLMPVLRSDMMAQKEDVHERPGPTGDVEPCDASQPGPLYRWSRRDGRAELSQEAMEIG